MKKIISALLCLSIILSLCACSNTVPSATDDSELPASSSPEPSYSMPVGNGSDPEAPESKEEELPAPADKRTDFVITKNDTEDGITVELSRMPLDLTDIESVSLKDEYISAALVVTVLSFYEQDPETCFAMLDYMMGPSDISDFDKNFIKNQFDQYPYVARSYRMGALPDNDYVTEAVSYLITENSYSRSEEGYVKLFFQSGGADSPRGLTLRHKGSTDQWFLFSDSYKGLLAGIRPPVSEDEWA